MAKFFPPDWSSSHAKFKAAVEEASGEYDSVELGELGPSGEELSVAFGIFGNKASPRKLFIYSSGVHGVEGFAGSAIQQAVLNLRCQKEGGSEANSSGERAWEVPSDTMVLFIHIVNPFGMAYLRRWNENNVDLNRNCLEDGHSGCPPGYNEVYDFLNPSTTNFTFDCFTIRALWTILRKGFQALKVSIASGQYDHEKGLFFGGKELQKGPRLIQEWITEHVPADGIEKVVAVDLHTGLGPWAQNSILVPSRHVSPDAAKVFSSLLPTHKIEQHNEDHAVAYPVKGSFTPFMCSLFPKAETRIGCVTEYGTHKALSVFEALRKENAFYQFGDGRNIPLSHPVKQKVREVFCPSNEQWKEAIVADGIHVYETMLKYLVSSGHAPEASEATEGQV